MSVHFMKAERIERFEYPVLILLATLGMLMMVSANDMIALYLGLELQSLALYVVAAIDRDSTRSSEAGLKYFVLGALSSGMLLYGMSLVYGFTGSTNFNVIAAHLAEAGGQLGLIFGLVFLLAGWPSRSPRCRSTCGRPTSMKARRRRSRRSSPRRPRSPPWRCSCASSSSRSRPSPPTGSRSWCSSPSPRWCWAPSRPSARRNIKRLLAYSSIGHVGYALVGLAAGTPEGVRGVIVYLIIYLAMTLGTFGCILTMRGATGRWRRSPISPGLARTNRPMAFVLAMMMFSLAGIPPLAGFFAKYFVFLAAIQAGLVALAVIGVVASVVGAFYYLRIVKLMFFDEPVEAFEPMPSEIKLVVAVSAVFVFGFVIVAEPIVVIAHAAAASLF
jgi:NADH-quinone oxidoreductase subunit N